MKTMKKMVLGIAAFLTLVVCMLTFQEVAELFSDTVMIANIAAMGRVSLRTRRNIRSRFKKRVRQKQISRVPIIVPSYLRVETELKDGINVYEFDITKARDDLSVERKLDKNDEFVITHLGVFIYEQVIAEIGRGVLQTYPNAKHFTNVLAGDIADLELVYNAEMSIKVGNVVFLPNFPCNLFRKVPRTQEGVVTSGTIDASNVIVNTLQLHSEWEASDGLYPIEPTIKLSGQGSNEIKIELPNFTNAVLSNPDAATKNMVVFRPIGFVIKNAATRRK